MSNSLSTSPDSSRLDSATSDVIIVGAGLAGLACASRLSREGKRVRLLEATDRVGGRLRTDRVDGFQLDHGFQVLLTAYPACHELLDYDALQLQAFQPGAIVRLGEGFTQVSDPRWQPSETLQTAFSVIGSLGDKWRVAKLARRVTQASLDELFARPQQSTESYLRDFGFSEEIIDRFFRPFLGGVFLERELQTSSRMFEFVFRMFASDVVAVPAAGMAAIPEQLAAGLPAGTIELEATVASIRGNAVTTTDGRTQEAGHVVVATEASAAARLLGDDQFDCGWHSTQTYYFAADAPPIADPILMLDGTGRGPVNHLAVISNVAPQYAPPGKALVSANVLGKAEDPLALVPAVRQQLREWFGAAVDGWSLLRNYSIPYALPQQSPDRCDPVEKRLEWSGGEGRILVCGDHRETSSIQGALNSGLRAANQLLKRL